jgi:hypothetical protein
MNNNITRFEELMKERKAFRKEVFATLRALTPEIRNQVAKKAGWSSCRSLGSKLYYSSEISDEWVLKFMKAMDELKLSILVVSGENVSETEQD